MFEDLIRRVDLARHLEPIGCFFDEIELVLWDFQGRLMARNGGWDRCLVVWDRYDLDIT